MGTYSEVKFVKPMKSPDVMLWMILDLKLLQYCQKNVNVSKIQ